MEPYRRATPPDRSRVLRCGPRSRVGNRARRTVVVEGHSFVRSSAVRTLAEGERARERVHQAAPEPSTRMAHGEDKRWSSTVPRAARAPYFDKPFEVVRA